MKISTEDQKPVVLTETVARSATRVRMRGLDLAGHALALEVDADHLGLLFGTEDLEDFPIIGHVCLLG